MATRLVDLRVAWLSSLTAKKNEHKEKEKISIGSDADLVPVDMNKTVTLQVGNFHSAEDIKTY